MPDGHGTLMKLALTTLVFAGLITFGLVFMNALQEKTEKKSNDLFESTIGTAITEDYHIS